jgi:hyperosmotically inducible protein
MKALAFAVSAVLALALAACAGDRPRNQTGGSTSTEVKQDSKNAALTAKVKTALASDVGLRTLTGINVDSEGTVVTLKGKVDTEENKRRAEQVAQRVEGVSSVRNQLTVEGKR